MCVFGTVTPQKHNRIDVTAKSDHAGSGNNPVIGTKKELSQGISVVVATIIFL